MQSEQPGSSHTMSPMVQLALDLAQSFMCAPTSLPELTCNSLAKGPVLPYRSDALFLTTIIVGAQCPSLDVLVHMFFRRETILSRFSRALNHRGAPSIFPWRNFVDPLARTAFEAAETAFLDMLPVAPRRLRIAVKTRSLLALRAVTLSILPPKHPQKGKGWHRSARRCPRRRRFC